MLSEENIKKIIFGGIYEADDKDIEKYFKKYTSCLNDQKYRIWIPTHYKKNDKDEYYMIDTYQVKSELFDNQYSTNRDDRFNGLIKGLEKVKDAENGGNWLASMPYNYYYSAIIKLTDENIDIFKLKADLHEYRLSNDKECRNYNEEDIIEYLRLYNEHCYPYGITIVRKDAKINYKNMIDAKLSDILKDIDSPNYACDYMIEELDKIIKEANDNNAEYDIKKANAIKKYNASMKELRKLSNSYLNELNKEIYNYS